MKMGSNPSEKTGKTPLDYVPCISEAFQRITKGSSYYRRILLLHNPKGITTYKAKMEKRLGITLRQSYVTRITTMLNSGMIPTGNSNTVVLQWCHFCTCGATIRAKVAPL